MKRRFTGTVAATAAAGCLVLGTGVAHAAAPGVQVSVLTTFPGQFPAAAAATNSGDVAAPVGTGNGANIVSIGPKGQQTVLATTPGGVFGVPIGLAYGNNHQLYAALPENFGANAAAAGTVLHISPNGKTAAVPGSEGMIAPDGFGFDSSTGNMYVTDISGNSIWRINPQGTAQLWSSEATNPLLVSPDGVKVFNGSVYTSLSGGQILQIPINPDGSAGTATIWAQLPGAWFDDMTLDDRTGDVYVARLDTNELLQITPGGVITTIASHDDGLLGAANMTLIHVGQTGVIYIANSNEDLSGHNVTGGAGPAVLKITFPSPSH
jgi:hypothetical protein